MLVCTNCAHPVSHDATAGRLPPWCPNCGASLRFDDVNANATATLPERRADGAPLLTLTPGDEAIASARLETMPTFAEPPRTSGLFRMGGLVLLVLGLGFTFKAWTDPDDWFLPLVSDAACLVLLVVWWGWRKGSPRRR